MNAEQMRLNYIDCLLKYIKMEYFENLPEQLNQEMIDYINNCFEGMVCLPNAAGKFCELYKTQKERS